ncbi:polyhydroxyalkanoate depolymerase [Kordiimonas pumila]|uniref:Polyhydroxyalkanoate depolymerase n=1 Tax=Kordiimonas pumila TaxID=2161677 RepID=A0ABV7D8P5_9PROT|nr:polyhydroxyalkanoate depolymerase [Kordiimonas pumila]
MIAQSPITYDYFESLRQTNQWLGATTKAFWRNPAFGLTPSPIPRVLAGWGEVVERAHSRVQAKPDWGIETIVIDEREYVVSADTVVDKPFCNLIHFRVNRKETRKKPASRRVLLVAPMSGHHATLIRKTVKSLLPDCEVFVTDWKNARDVPLSKGKFDIEDYTLYLVDFMKELGSDLNVIAICQPAPLALAATAILAEEKSDAQPRTLTLIGGPIDTSVSKTDVTVFGDTYSIEQLETSVVHTVGSAFKGFGRQVYPGAIQLSAFMSMKWQMHLKSHINEALAIAQGEATDHDYHNTFYDEYLSVMDMTAEFYLSTVERVFQKHEIGKNKFVVNGKKVDIGKITRTAVKTVEGGKDDITAPGQCKAAHGILTGLPENKKAHHLEPDAGHYGIFSGTSWRVNIRPMVLAFIDANSEPVAAEKAEPVKDIPEKPKIAATPPPTKTIAVKTGEPVQKAKATTVKKKAVAKRISKPAVKKAGRAKAIKAKPVAPRRVVVKETKPEPVPAKVTVQGTATSATPALKAETTPAKASPSVSADMKKPSKKV